MHLLHFEAVVLANWVLNTRHVTEIVYVYLKWFQSALGPGPHRLISGSGQQRQIL